MGFQETQGAADGGGRPLQAPGCASETALINGSHEDFHCVDTIHLPAPGKTTPVATTYQIELWQAQNDECNGADGERRTLNDVRRREITPARTVYARRGAILSEADGLSLSVSPGVNHRLGKGMGSFLRQIMTDAPFDQTCPDSAGTGHTLAWRHELGARAASSGVAARRPHLS